MKTIEDLTNRAKELHNGLESGAIVQRIIKNNEAYIVDMNTEDQLYEKGINRVGVSISDYAPYSPVTIQIKSLKGQPTNRVTLRDEGDFHNSFYIVADDRQFEIKASDDKTEFLIRKYGRQILGLTDENIASVIWDYIMPDLLQETKNILL